MSVTARSTRKSLALVLLACTSAVPMLSSACKQPAPAVVDAGPPPPAATDAAPAILVPMDEDAGLAIDAAPPPVHHAGAGGNTNQLRAKQCCNALARQAGTDPSLAGLVAMCNQVAAQIGPSSGGEAPEFAAIRNALKGKTIPSMCSGL